MYVKYKDHMGTDLSICNDARISFDRETDWECVTEQISPNIYVQKPVLSKKDKGLLQFLARGCTSGDWEGTLKEIASICGTWYEDWLEDLGTIVKEIKTMPTHWTPFGQTAVKLEVHMPIFVARQWMKHTTGFVYNEISRRYVDNDPEFYEPLTWRAKSDDKKQGSGGPVSSQYFPSIYIQETHKEALERYRKMLVQGVCPEQARMILPQSMYTTVRQTGNLYAWATLFNTRTRPDVQKETRDLALQIDPIMMNIFPEAWKALTQ